jgi:integrase
MFDVLRAKCPDLPDELTPHMLRHTNNDLFSKKMDAKKIPEHLEEKLRSQLMGWSPNSKTASTYTKRHVREQASEASLSMQNDVGKGIKNDK